MLVGPFYDVQSLSIGKPENIIFLLTAIKEMLTINGEDIKRSSDFCYLGSTVAENGGTSREEVQEYRRWGDHSPN